jgi:hypothetical protein
MAAAAGGGALLAVASGAPLFAVVLLLCCLGALVLRRTWITSEQEYLRARVAMREAELREERGVRTETLLARNDRNAAVVARTERRELWVGETADQLRDALGEPEGIEIKKLKTRSREIWKYGRTGRNRYSTRITLDNGTVVRWQRRDPVSRPHARHETHP